MKLFVRAMAAVAAITQGVVSYNGTYGSKSPISSLYDYESASFEVEDRLIEERNVRGLLSSETVTNQLYLRRCIKKAMPVAEDRCMEELGCFLITTDFYHPLWRVLNAQVDPREKIHTTFLFYTRENKDMPDYLIGYKIRGDALETVHFNAELPTKVIIHGFLDTQFFGAWMSELKDKLLTLGNFNVIIVDWSGGNSLPYTQATANTRVVGAEVAVLIQKLM
ncbi:pancreatic triacylglycerol lipase-like, partial [Tropilaelaps mercedesae]